MNALGLIGAGVMGLAAAGRIIQAGRTLFAYDVTPSAKNNAAGLGVNLCDTPAGVAEKADVILMFLPGPREVELCVAGPDGLLAAPRSGMVIVDMSTVDPGVTQRMAELARQKGVGYLDAPVLGRPVSVGKWALPVGGKGRNVP